MGEDILNEGLINKVRYLTELPNDENITDSELNIIKQFADEPEKEGRLGKVFGYSLSDWAIASMYRLKLDEMFSEYLNGCDKYRQEKIRDLIKLIENNP